jgi:hypothetical protein
MAREIHFKRVKYPRKREFKWGKILLFVLLGIFIVLFAASYFNKTDTGNSRVISEEQKQPDVAFINFVIELNDARHLDKNRDIVNNIYEEVKELDDIWSEEIKSEEYIRITFEQELDSSRDITIYPRIADGEPRIEVYEVDENEIIAEFINIQSNEYNKVLLTNLVGEQDVFDLRVLDGSLEFDYVFDPEGRIKPITPDNISQWPTVTGCTNHYDCVDEDIADNATSEIECDANVIYYDYFNTNASFSAGTHAIKNVTVYALACIDSSKATNFAVCANVSATSSCSTDYGISILSVCPSWTTYSYFMDVSPDTTLEWTVDEVNEMLIGVRAGVDCNPDIHVTQVYSIVGYETVAPPDDPPTVTLNSPVDYANFSSTINFNCTGQDDIKVENVSLYGNWTGTWLLNQTNSTPVNNTPTIFTKTITGDGTYKWNCEACDNKTTSQCTFATANRTFTVDSTPPYFTDLDNQTSYDNESLNYDINATDDGIGFDSFSIDDTTNFSINSATGVITNITILIEYYYVVNVSINDTLGNLNWSLWSLNVTEAPDLTPPTIMVQSPINNTSILH